MIEPEGILGMAPWRAKMRMARHPTGVCRYICSRANTDKYMVLKTFAAIDRVKRA